MKGSRKLTLGKVSSTTGAIMTTVKALRRVDIYTPEQGHSLESRAWQNTRHDKAAIFEKQYPNVVLRHSIRSI
jgi:hypothetical protein